MYRTLTARNVRMELHLFEIALLLGYRSDVVIVVNVLTVVSY